jgi:hypothetical protein
LKSFSLFALTFWGVLVLMSVWSDDKGYYMAMDPFAVGSIHTPESGLKGVSM